MSSAKISPVSVLASAVAIYLFGFLWYGVIFAKTFQAESGISEKSEGAGGAEWMAAGFVIELVKSVGITWLLGRGASLQAALVFGGKLGALFGVTGSAYAFVYSLQHNATLFALDGTYTFLTFVVGALVAAAVDAYLAAPPRTTAAAAASKSPKRVGRSRSPARR